MSKSLLRLAALAVAAVALSGCITLFPEAKPSQLYRFEIAGPSSVDAKGLDVTRGPIAFSKAASSDGILAVTNGEVAYIDGARWVAPAQQLFEEQLVRAFQPGPVRLIGRGEMGHSAYILRLDVQHFEAVYKGDPEGAPTVLVEIKAAMTKNERDGATYEQVFRAEVPAGDNRVSAIVPAFDKALGQALGQLNGWVSSYQGK